MDEPAKGLAEGGPVGGDGEIEGGHGEGVTTRWAGSHWQSRGRGRAERGRKEIFEGAMALLNTTRFRFTPCVSITIFDYFVIDVEVRGTVLASVDFKFRRY